MFCDEKCMNEARERLHNIECAAMETLYGKLSSQVLEECSEYRMIASMVAVLAESLQAFGSVKKIRALLAPKPDATIFDFDLSSTDWKARQKAELRLFHMLQPRRDSNKNKQYEFFATSIIDSKCFDKFIKSREDRKSLIEYAVQSALKLSLNGFEPTGREESQGILLFGSYFNHACDQNVGHTLIDNKIVFVVLKPIAKGEQLFISYDTLE
jgi:hypothetical protein